jgi:hypothetical protein
VTVFFFVERHGLTIDNLDAGSYLTERLRTLQPDSFEAQVERAKRRSRRLGVFIGATGSLAVLFLGVFALWYFMPEMVDTLIAGIQ